MGANGGGCLGRTMQALFTGCVYSSLFFSSSKSVIWGGGTSWSLPMWDQSFPELSELWAIIHIYACLFLELLLSHFGCSWEGTWTRNLSAKHRTNANQNDISPRRLETLDRDVLHRSGHHWSLGPLFCLNEPKLGIWMSLKNWLSDPLHLIFSKS